MIAAPLQLSLEGDARDVSFDITNFASDNAPFACGFGHEMVGNPDIWGQWAGIVIGLD